MTTSRPGRCMSYREYHAGGRTAAQHAERVETGGTDAYSIRRCQESEGPVEG